MSVRINVPHLKAELARRGLTQQEFAVLANVAPNTVTNAMNGHGVHQFVLRRMAAALQNAPVLAQLDELIEQIPLGAA